jgi:tetratricopeptide (TPR) repeat protein
VLGAHGPSPVHAGIAFCDDVLGRGLNDPLIDIFALEKRGLLEAMQAQFEKARASVSSAQRIADELELQVRKGMCREYAGRIELLAGDPEAAERELRAGYDLLGSLGESAFRASIGESLAEALYQLGRFAQGAAALGDDDPATDALRGKILACMGDLERGEHLARRAVESLKTFDYLDARAKAPMGLAAVLRLAERFPEAVGRHHRCNSSLRAEGEHGRRRSGA